MGRVPPTLVATPIFAVPSLPVFGVSNVWSRNIPSHALFVAPGQVFTFMGNHFAPTRQAKYRLWFGTHWWLLVLFFGSIGLVTFILCGAVIHWLRGKIITNDDTPPKKDLPKLWPDIKTLHLTKNERYYLQQLGLDLEYIKLVADDGQVLHLHHVIDPNETQELRDHRKPLLMQHGLLALLGAYFTSGFNSLAYMFTKQGYDVYLSNNRLWFEFESNDIEGNLKHLEPYWDWELRDLAGLDLPCHIEAVLLRKPLHNKLIYFGHSQGCTQMVINLRNPDMGHIHEKIEFLGLLCPAIYPGELFHTRGFLRFLRWAPRWMFRCFIGPCVFMGILGTCRHYMATWPIFGQAAFMLMSYLFGWGDDNFEPGEKIRHLHFMFCASYILGRLMNWWTSHFVDEGFASELLHRKAYESDEHYRWGSQASPINAKSATELFFPFEKEWFGQLGVKIPMCVFTGGQDFLVDGLRFASHMKNGEPNYKMGENLWHFHLDSYNHVDITWAQSVPEEVGERLLLHMRALERDEVVAQDEQNRQIEPKEVAEPATLPAMDISETMPSPAMEFVEKDTVQLILPPTPIPVAV